MNVTHKKSTTIKSNVETPPLERINKTNSFLCFLLSWSAFVIPVKAMDGEKETFLDWPGLFLAPQHGNTRPLGPHILGYLDNRSLGRAAQVSHGWKQTVDQAQHIRLDFEKQDLYALILELTGAEANEVQKAHDALESYLQMAPRNREEERNLCNRVNALKPRLVQPEFLIRRSNESLFNQLLSSNDLQKTHAALTPLVTLIQDLQEFLILPDLQPLLCPLASHYEAYLNKLLSPSCDRLAHLHPKALLSGEGFLGNIQGFRSYRLSQEMARSLLSKDEYGLSAKTNTQGNHAVCFKRSQVNPTHGVHFKGNTANTGLPVGRESAVYALSQILFPQDAFQGRASASALLTLNEVEIKTPLEGTDVSKAFVDALRDGKTSEEFFAHFPLYEKEFTQKDPSHVLQASLHVEGLSLEDFIDGVDKGKYTYNQIDLPSFSEHLFLSMLTQPTDGTPGNFMLRKNERKGSGSVETFSIVGIDNDMALEVGDTYVENVQSQFIPGQKIITQQKHCVRVKNILMCLPLMNQPLSPTTVKKILALNPELLTLQWLERVSEQNIRYEQLQGATYITSSLKQAPEPYVSRDHVTDLHLPFLLDPDFIPRFCQTIRQIQTYLVDHKALTHWQLLLNIHPLAGRFYQETVAQAQGSVMKAYLKIDPPKSDPGKPRKDVIYLEDVLSLDEKLLNGQTTVQALKDVTHRADGTQKFTQLPHEAAEQLLRETDLFQQSSLSPFLRPALESFGELIQRRSEPNSATHLHPSWFKDALLHKAISEKLSLSHLKRLLELGLDVTVMDKERRTTLRDVLDQGGDPEFTSSLLSLLKSFCPADQLISWVNTVASDRLTALDIALEKRQIPAFKELVTSGAFVCHPNIALKFYRDVIKTTNDTSLKQSFLKLTNLNDEIRWHVCLEEMLPPYNPKANQEGPPLFTAKFGKRLLPDSIKEQILDHENQWKPYTQEGNHLVCRATLTNETMNIEHSLYFKVYPELPGIEEAVGLLTRKLLNYGAPHTELVNIGGCPVLLSHSHGDKTKTLDTMLRNHLNILEDLDEESLSGLILMAMLTNPEDGKPANYVVEPHPTNLQKYRIVGIDNDHAFVPAIVTEKPKKEWWTGKSVPIAQVKTILYCLDQMKNPVHPTIQDLFIALRPDELLDEWLRELKKVNTSYSDLFPYAPDHVKFREEHDSFLGIPFQKGAISHLYDKFLALQNILSSSPGITHLEVLAKLEPRLAKRYQLASGLPTMKERWDAVDAGFYEKTKSNSATTLTHSGNILKSMDIPLKESVLESIRLGKGLGPIQALEELKSQIKTLKSLGLGIGDLNLFTTLTLESSRVLFLKELAKQKKTLKFQEQTAILDYLSKQKDIRELPLSSFSAMDDSLFQKINFEYLIKADLRKCTHITCRSLVHLSQATFALEDLNLGFLTQLNAIGNLGLWDIPLIFRELKILNLSDCINLDKLLLQAPKLHYLNITNCALLTDQTLDGVIRESKNLKTLRLEGAAKISGISYREEHPTFTFLENNLNPNEQVTQGYKYSIGEGVVQDNKEAFKWYLNAALQGNATAQSNLGWMYDIGRGVPQDDKEACKWYKKAADQGNATAQSNLGNMYHNGRGVPQDDKEAVKWYQKAADQGNADAQFNLGWMYRNGQGVPQDNQEAVKWYQKAANQGNATAQSNLGWMYDIGRGVPQDDKEACKWYKKAADQGNATAQSNLGNMYHNGRGVPQDDKEAVRWYQKAADQGDAFAQTKLGWMYSIGCGVAQDDKGAVKWYQKAADQGNADAQSNLGWMYRNGQGVPQDNQEAVKWYQKAANQGNAAAQFNLGFMYANGRGVSQDDKEACKWYQKAADQGNADAQFNLGWMYRNGQGVPQDNQEAVKWYQKAANQGNAAAQFNLGFMYANGRGVSQDDKEACKWYQKAAEQGDAQAQFKLGFMYANGRGVPRDDQETVKWYQKAADQGNTTAQFNLGWMYRTGRGVLQDDQEAAKWYKKTADQGDVPALSTLGWMYQ